MVENHSLLINFPKSSTLATNNQVTKETVDSVNTSLENFVNRTYSFVSTCLYNYFDNVATPSPTVDVSVSFIDSYTVYSAFYLTKLNVKF